MTDTGTLVLVFGLLFTSLLVSVSISAFALAVTRKSGS